VAVEEVVVLTLWRMTMSCGRDVKINNVRSGVQACVCTRESACVRASEQPCVRACVRACARAHLRAHASARAYVRA
jgi:hypothetical protein